MPPDASEDPKLQPAVAPDPTPAPRKMVINEKAVLIVATALAKAHHGDHVEDAGGYMELARSFIVAAVAMHDLTEPPLVEVADPNVVLADAEPVQEPIVQPSANPDPHWTDPGFPPLRQEPPPQMPSPTPSAQPAPANA